MKDYELKAKLEQELRWASHKYDTANNRVEIAKEEIQHLYERHKLIEAEEESYIKDLEETKADFFEILKAKQYALDNFGKKLCPHCNKFFTSQGIKSHELACTENPTVIEAKEAKKAEILKKRDEENKRKLEEARRQREEEERQRELEELIEDRKLASEELKELKEEINHETEEIQWLQDNHMDWIREYMEEEGGNAIWRGTITKGFRAFLDAKGYIIGE